MHAIHPSCPRCLPYAGQPDATCRPGHSIIRGITWSIRLVYGKAKDSQLTMLCKLVRRSRVSWSIQLQLDGCIEETPFQYRMLGPKAMGVRQWFRALAVLWV